MTLRLSVENVDRLPDGGPLRVEVKGRGLDLGRDAHLDWTLADPTRSISGKHCEIRYRDGGYWLHDVSTNGTFVNEAPYRLDAPYLLRNGDKLGIGPYIVAVQVESGPRQAAPAAGPEQALPADLWRSSPDAAAPDSPAARPARNRPPPDFPDFAVSLDVLPSPSPAVEDWFPPNARPAPRAQPDIPAPRRPAAPEPARDAAAQPAQDAPAPAAPAVDALTLIARAAGIPDRVLAERDAQSLAEDIGAALRLTVENLAQLLSSRSEAKAVMRSANRTMIRARENNPLKFTASPEDALALMFGRPQSQYLDARATLQRSFADLKSHQALTYGAVQAALEALFEDLAPDRISESVAAEKGLGAIVQSRKARAWDVYAERWRGKTRRADGRLFDAFAALFAEAYDKLQDRGGAP